MKIKEPYTTKEEPFQYVYANNRKELQHLANQENIHINWILWDELVKTTKQDITNALEDFNEPIQRYSNGKPFKSVYTYNLDGQFINSFKTPQEAAQYYGISPITVNQAMRNNIPIYKLRVYFSKLPIT